MSIADPGGHFPGANASKGATADMFRFWDGVTCLDKCDVGEEGQNNLWPISADMRGY